MNAEQKEQDKRERKLYMQKKRQQRHRDRQRQLEMLCEKRVRDLHAQNVRLVLYQRFLKQMRSLELPHLMQLRGLVVELYGDYFRYGVDAHDENYYEKQIAFMELHFSRECILHCPTRTRGYYGLIEQLKVYTDLYDRFEAITQSVERYDATGSIYSLSQKVRVTVTKRAIGTIYPHMMYDREFMKKALDKVLVFHYNLVLRFREGTSTIEAVHIDHQIPEAWCNLLQDSLLTARLLDRANIDEAGFVRIDFVKTNQLQEHKSDLVVL